MRRRLGAALRSELFWVAAAFLIRAAFAACLGERTYQADEGGYDAIAWHWARTGVLGGGGEATVVSPVAPLFFGLFYLAGHRMLAARVAHAAVSAATAWMLGRMTGQLTGSRRAGLFALALSAVYPFFIYYSGILMTETLYVAGVVAGLWAICASLRERGASAWRAAAAGAALAVAGLTRPQGVPIALGLWVSAAVLCMLKRYRWRSWALAVLCWALPLAGWAARNHGVCGRYTLSLKGGFALIDGVMFFDLNEMDTAFARQAFRTTPLYEEGRSLGPAERDRLYRRAVFRFMVENPRTVLRQWVHKAFNFWRFYPRVDKEYPDTEGARPGVGASRRNLVAVSLLFEPAIILLGFYGAFQLRARAAELWPLYWMVLATFGMHVVIISQMRYRLPVMPVLILFACAAADAALRRLRPDWGGAPGGGR
ncbi:MAG: glycosyltransferase family 39 protein [Elusimicrobiota bacterium]